jgi:hypothetical protein
MANVYGGAWLTVAASWGSSMHDGIFRTRPSLDMADSVEIGLQSLAEDTRKSSLSLVPKHRPPVESMLEPLYRRGWALQERILSQRVLVCNRDQFVWECQCECFTESGFRMQGIGAMRLDREFHQKLESDVGTFQNTWQCIVTDYSAKLLTKASDKLPAIGGLAKKFHDLRPGNVYLAGLWLGSLLDDLLWVHSNIHYWNQQVGVGVVRSKPLQYRVPSWSWASVDGGVRWPFSNKNETGEYHAKLIDYHVTLKGSNTFGELDHAYLVLEAPLWRLPETMKHMMINREEHHSRVQDYATWRLGPWQQIDPVRRDIHVPGLSLAQSMGQGKLDDTDVFFMKIRDDVSLILASSKLEEPHSGGLHAANRCYERLSIHGPTAVVDRFAWPEGVSPEYVMATCKLV